MRRTATYVWMHAYGRRTEESLLHSWIRADSEAVTGKFAVRDGHDAKAPRRLTPHSVDPATLTEREPLHTLTTSIVSKQSIVIRT